MAPTLNTGYQSLLQSGITRTALSFTTSPWVQADLSLPVPFLLAVLVSQEAPDGHRKYCSFPSMSFFYLPKHKPFTPLMLMIDIQPLNENSPMFCIEYEHPLIALLTLNDFFLSPVVLGSHPPSFLVGPKGQYFLCYPDRETAEQLK